MKHDFPISQLRMVTIYYHNDGKVSEHSGRHMMHEDQVETFVKATVALHHSPGINPHNGVEAASLWEIRFSQVETDAESYWWSTPDLQRNGDPMGAQLNAEILDQRLWAHPLLLKQDESNRAWLERQEYLDG